MAHLFLVKSEYLFQLLLGDNINVQGTFIPDFVAKRIRSGTRDILSVALINSEIFHVWKVLISRSILFRCRSDAPFKFYSPTTITIMDIKSFKHLSSPSHLFIIKLDDNFKIPPLPSTVTHLYVYKISANQLPPNLTHLTVYSTFSGNMPATITFAEIEEIVSEDIFIPPKLTHFKLSKSLYRGIQPFPSSLTSLNLSFPLLLPLYNFPPNLTSISIGYSSYALPPLPSSLLSFSVFSSGLGIDSFQSTLPSSLTSIHFPHKFRDNDFTYPPNLLELSCDSTSSITLFKLPSSLLSLEYSPTAKVIMGLPNNLQNLCLNFSGQFSLTLPPSIVKIKLPFTNISNYPPTLKHIIFTENANFILTTIPSSVTHLTFGFYNYKIPSLPPQLLFLKIECTRSPLPTLPISLTYLEIGLINFKINLPPFLTCLKLGTYFNQNIYPLPSTLQYLELGNHFNQHIPKFPSSLISLKFGNNFDKPLHLPPYLKILSLGRNYYQILPEIPKSIMWLFCFKSWYDNHSHKIHPFCFVYFDNTAGFQFT